jgi:hypothetical protein
VVIGAEQDLHREVEALLGAGEAQDVVGFGLRVHLGDGAAECGVAECLGVPERQRLPRRAVVVIRQREQFGHRHRLRVGRGEVVPRRELPVREVGLELEVGQGGHDIGSFGIELRAWSAPGPIVPTPHQL